MTERSEGISSEANLELLNQRLRDDLAAESKRRETIQRTYATIAIALSTIVAILLTALLLDEVNVIELERIYDHSASIASGAEGAQDEVDKTDDVKSDLTDLLGAFLPFATIAIAAFLGVTGLNRLGQYDAELRQNRQERRAEMDSLRQELSSGLAQANATLRDTAETMTQTTAREYFEKESRRLEQLKESTDKAVNEIKAQIDGLTWVLESESAESFQEGEIKSFGELHRVLTAMSGRFQDQGESNPRAIKTLIEQYFPKRPESRDDLPFGGGADDAFNAATQLARDNLEPLAWRLCEAGLLLFPENADLLSNAMRFASDAGEPERAEELFWRVYDLEHSKKNWRCWVFAHSYLERGTVAQRTITLDGGETVRETVDVETWFERYIELYYEKDSDGQWTRRERPLVPNTMDERLFASHVQYLSRLGRKTEALRYARMVLNALPRAAQTALVAAEIHLSFGEYQDCIAAARRSVGDDASDQGTSNSAAAFMYEANAWDMMAFAASRTNGPREHLIEYATNALRAYDMSIRLPDAHDVNRHASALRTGSLVAMLIRNGVDSDEMAEILPQQLAPIAAGILPGRGESERMGAGGLGASGEQLQSVLAQVKMASVLSDDERHEVFNHLADGLSGATRGLAKRLALQAAGHFEDDEDEAGFVSALREFAGILDE